MSLRTLIVDDEALARSRLRTLLESCEAPTATVLAEAAMGDEALRRLKDGGFDVVLLDIQMPGIDGIELARAARQHAQAPAIIFVTAHTTHAVTAFELDAVDYLTKPVRAERLQQALQKAQRHLQERRTTLAFAMQDSLLIEERGRAERVPLSQVIYLKSELKYLTVRTAMRNHILDGSLSDFEAHYAAHFVRVHRNALVARHAIRSLERSQADETEGWALRLHGVNEAVPVSRRQLGAVRALLRSG